MGHNPYKFSSLGLMKTYTNLSLTKAFCETGSNIRSGTWVEHGSEIATRTRTRPHPVSLLKIDTQATSTLHTTIPLEMLRELAIHAYKLQKNRLSDSLRPFSIHLYDMEDEVDGLFPIEGTRMIITNSKSCVACWDTVSGACIASSENASVWEIPTISLLRLAGACYVGMSRFRWFSFDGGVKLNGKREGEIGWSCRERVISGNIWPQLMCDRRKDPQAVCPVTTTSTQLSDTIVGDEFYITWQNIERTSVEIMHVLAPPLKRNLHMHHITKDIPAPIFEEACELTSCSTRYPAYGIIVTSRRGRYKELRSLHLWPAEYDGALVPYDHNSEISMLAVGTSTATCGFIVDCQRGRGLVQYVPQPALHVEFRVFDIPNMQVQPFRVALDDRLGILYMADCAEGGKCRLAIITAFPPHVDRGSVYPRR
ncbi:hypothetical protein DFH07DRAFT_782477 [Mycena maculata]|uniref:Uncharacterized protein n=1 Tax=Mycena maculata TaxID=230809 RepID=A0AAD7HU63_9AGAR|nr:hypothetical protein DFH07DRAFT_782477 [Mycena maculata]